MTKRGWRDAGSETLQTRIKESNLEGKPISTFFDLIEYDEGRDPVATQPWR
jgi:gluconokinase